MSASPALEVFDRYVVELEQLAADKREAGDTAEVIELEIGRTKQARDNVERLIAAAPELLEACQTFSEWLRREEAGGEGQAWREKRDTAEGEASWREWYGENLRLCALAQDQARAAIAKAIGGAA